MNQEKIGKYIANLRKEKNITQQELADQLNVTDRAVGNWENGRRLPDISLIKELCEIFAITIDELLYGGEIKVEKQKEVLKNNAVKMYLTKRKIENLQLLTEILIVIGIFITITISSVFVDTTKERIIIWGLGLFIWGFGIVLRVILTKIHMMYKD